MKKTIENPKVFISYAWGSKEHDEKVLAFASNLVSNGIDVVLDKWDMTEGNDTYAFMERSVTDPTITNVLMLIDPVYAKKADAHTGGVGTETQIISTQVYQKVDQNKFIPVVFERGDAGEICKPTYLQNRLHFDLTIEEKYDEEYQRLIRKLYGVDTYVKPEKGEKPSWVDNPVSYSPKSIIRYEELKQNTNSIIKGQQFRSFLSQIADRIASFSRETNKLDSNEAIVEQYDRTQDIRNDYLLLMRYSVYVDKYIEDIASFFEDISNTLDSQNSMYKNLAKTFIHELFIYTVCCLWNNKEYNSLGYLFGRTYFTRSYSGNDNGACSYTIVYSGTDHDALDRAVKSIDGKNYHSGVASHWINNIANDFCSKEMFVFADLLCYNYAIYGKNYLYYFKWFPITYIYDNRYDSLFMQFGKKLISRQHLNTYLPIFGFDTVEEFIENYKNIHSEEEFRANRYPQVFEPAAVLGFIVKPEAIGTLP